MTEKTTIYWINGIRETKETNLSKLASEESWITD